MQYNLFTFLVCFGTGILASPVCSNETGDQITLNLLPESISSLQLALFLENLEIAFARSAAANLTATDTEFGDNFNESIANIVTQEVGHQTALQNILLAAGEDLVAPCRYEFPSRNTSEFVELACSLSIVAVGAGLTIVADLPDEDKGLATGLASIVATEARHNTFFESTVGNETNSVPFETPIPEAWALNLALGFVVPGSCPVIPPFPILPSLTANMELTQGTRQVSFTWDPAQEPMRIESNKALFAAWLHELDPPTYTALNRTSTSSGTASFPEGIEGTVLVALTAQDHFQSMDELSASTLAGPAVLFV
ncbi:ferritin-like domain-containing protein [Xylariaceae sp. FL0255]|nr:ferritin-like domain-containing protein [Xylariaceae sp. FL0255]